MIYYVYPEGVFGLEAPLGYVEGNVIVYFEGYIIDIVYGMVVGQCAVYSLLCCGRVYGSLGHGHQCLLGTPCAPHCSQCSGHVLTSQSQTSWPLAFAQSPAVSAADVSMTSVIGIALRSPLLSLHWTHVSVSCSLAWPVLAC